MFAVKICGVTRSEDVKAAIQSVGNSTAAFALGLNFYAKSPRSVSIESAKTLADAARTTSATETRSKPIVLVGVFVNTPTNEIQKIVDSVGLDFVQLHGDEPPSAVIELAPTPVIRAFRLGPDENSRVLEYAQACDLGGHRLAAVLIDAAVPGAYGGTGEKADWNQVADLAQTLRCNAEQPKLILAGGLHPQNVAESIHVATPDGVDTASGVETAPGIKSPEMMESFLHNAHAAFAERRKSQ